MLNRRHKDEGAGARDACPLFSNPQPLHSAADPAKVKRFATATAKLALAGYSFVPLQAGSYLVGRWISSKVLSDLSAVELFLQKVSP